MAGPTTAISGDTLLQDDLGITGDDGDELLNAAAAHFGVVPSDLQRAFSLADDEVLFDSEGCLPLPRVPASLRHAFKLPPGKRARVRATTVRDLHQAVVSAQSGRRPEPGPRGCMAGTTPASGGPGDCACAADIGDSGSTEDGAGVGRERRMLRRVWDMVELGIAAVVIGVIATLVFWIIPCPNRDRDDGDLTAS